MKFRRRRLLQRLRKWPQFKIVKITNNKGEKQDLVCLMPEHPEHSDENMEFWISHWNQILQVHVNVATIYSHIYQRIIRAF